MQADVLHRLSRIVGHLRMQVMADATSGSWKGLALGSGPLVLCRPLLRACLVTASVKILKTSAGRYVKVVPLSSTVP